MKKSVKRKHRYRVSEFIRGKWVHWNTEEPDIRFSGSEIIWSAKIVPTKKDR